MSGAHCDSDTQELNTPLAKAPESCGWAHSFWEEAREALKSIPWRDWSVLRGVGKRKREKNVTRSPRVNNSRSICSGFQLKLWRISEQLEAWDPWPPRARELLFSNDQILSDTIWMNKCRRWSMISTVPNAHALGALITQLPSLLRLPYRGEPSLLLAT